MSTTILFVSFGPTRRGCHLLVDNAPLVVIFCQRRTTKHKCSKLYTCLSGVDLVLFWLVIDQGFKFLVGTQYQSVGVQPQVCEGEVPDLALMLGNDHQLGHPLDNWSIFFDILPQGYVNNLVLQYMLEVTLHITLFVPRKLSISR